MSAEYDVAIVGGGPAGSTAGALLKKYNPALSVAIFEKERFPRDHVGESQLPMVGRILQEMEVWDKIEAAEFPIKIGITFRWGATPELWDFDFLPAASFKDEPRPGRYEGQRIWTAWHVDRAEYDKILLDHAAEFGCEVREQTAVTKVDTDGDRVERLHLKGPDGESTVSARHYIGASGRPGVLRKAFNLRTDSPTTLQNVAFWDYWTDTGWATTIGNGGTRVQIMSVGIGWLWFIPISKTRTSIGLVCPKDYYQKCGKSPEELYEWALAQDPRITALTANAKRENNVRGTKDWSFLTERLAGDNWMLVGECAGFADPILSGGMALTHSSARHAAYNILEYERGQLDPAWLRKEYSETQIRRINQHIRFADFWYAGNGQFTDLQEFSRQIAADSGLKMTPNEAFHWLTTGGFGDDYHGAVGVGGQDVAAVKQLTTLFATRQEVPWEISKHNHFEVDVEEAEQVEVPVLDNGRIVRSVCFVRDGRRLPTFGLWADLHETLRVTNDLYTIYNDLKNKLVERYGENLGKFHADHAMQMLEVMLADGWVKGSTVEGRPLGKHFKSVAMTGNFKPNADELSRKIGSGAGPD